MDRLEVFRLAAEKMRADFRELQAIPHAGAKGTEGEQILKDFLNGYLPRRFAAGSGFVLNHAGEVSRQTDVVIYDALNCPVYRASDIAAIFPSDNVPAVIEVKSVLNKQSLEDAWDKVSAVKHLQRVVDLDAGQQRTVAYGVVFAYSSPLNLETLGAHYIGLFDKHGVNFHIDAIVVLDKGIISTAVLRPGATMISRLSTEKLGNSELEGTHFGIHICPHAMDTLDIFLRLLLIHCVMYRPVVSHPGFDPDSIPHSDKTKFAYVTSITAEQDPVLRLKKLETYYNQYLEYAMAVLKAEGNQGTPS